ncbi:MAG: hypothetical protein LBM60_07125, partial [Clostridium sp.]|nr:hypothetical protein [Clostridium sp.]
MAGITLEDNHIIYHIGQPMTALHLIVEGTVLVNFPGGSYRLTKGDAIGICEVRSELHILEYIAQGSVSILSYPCSGEEAFYQLVKKHPDIAGLFAASAIKQVTLLLEHYDISELFCNTYHQEFLAAYEYYELLCNRYHITKKLPFGIENVQPYLPQDAPDLWFAPYYHQMLLSAMEGSYKSQFKNPAISMGMIQKTCQDFFKIYSAIEDQNQYQLSITGCCFEQDGEDLLTLLVDLRLRIQGQATARKDMDLIQTHILRLIHSTLYNQLTQPRTTKRLEALMSQLSEQVPTNPPKDDGFPDDLHDSFETILRYADLEDTMQKRMRNDVYEYMNLLHQSVGNDPSFALRKRLTEDFNKLYATLFEKTLTDTDIPIPVMMCLYFGYLDEHLAGEDHALYLYHLSKTLQKDVNSSVYTLYHWLCAIYHGEKEPSRNELDQNYAEFIQKQKT